MKSSSAQQAANTARASCQSAPSIVKSKSPGAESFAVSCADVTWHSRPRARLAIAATRLGKDNRGLPRSGALGGRLLGALWLLLGPHGLDGFDRHKDSLTLVGSVLMANSH